MRTVIGFEEVKLKGESAQKTLFSSVGDSASYFHYSLGASSPQALAKCEPNQ